MIAVHLAHIVPFVEHLRVQNVSFVEHTTPKKRLLGTGGLLVWIREVYQLFDVAFDGIVSLSQ